ncbi:MAG: YdeI/OmpD-associated family protein [Ignavibacteriales bacterium]|nr:YdeI/OmpD-associated family protein [Ignavibacteriales bacterium]
MEQWIGYYKTTSGKPSITWPESVDQALCFGWIDGVRKSLGTESYTIRFTPRKPTSFWSEINIKKVAGLKKLGLMTQEGLDLFEKRNVKNSKQYSFEQRKNPKLPAAYARKFKANKKAWAFFSTQAPWYQRTSTWWVISAKREETRMKRLRQLIEDCEKGRRIGLVRSNKRN